MVRWDFSGHAAVSMWLPKGREVSPAEDHQRQNGAGWIWPFSCTCILYIALVLRTNFAICESCKGRVPARASWATRLAPRSARKKEMVFAYFHSDRHVAAPRLCLMLRVKAGQSTETAGGIGYNLYSLSKFLVSGMELVGLGILWLY